MKKIRSASAFAFALLAASSTFAASFIVPTDRELVRAAKAIVVATAQGSYAERVDERMINTVYIFRVEEVIKGEVALQELRVAEPGGVIGTEGLIFPGAPSYAPGERALVFLDVNNQGEYRTWSMGIGKFNFVRDAHGKRLLMRGQGDEAVFGWTATGNPHREVIRAEEQFLQFVRDEACGGVGDANYEVDEASVVWQPKIKANVNGSGFHACDYSSPIGGACGYKWQNIFDQPGGAGSVSFQLVGTQSGGADGPTAAGAGMAAWNNNALSNVNLGSGGSGPSQIKFDDTAGVTAGCGASAVGCASSSVNVSPFTFDTGSFNPLTQSVVSIKAGFTANQTLLNQVVCHELGHAIGFRHSDQGTPSTSSAIMNSVANSSSPIGANLQPWDTDAVQTIYNPSPGVTCSAPSVTSATATPSTITSGSSTTLSATATGSPTLTYQWYRGNPTDTSNPAGAPGASIPVSPTVTTTYWVRVTGQCVPPSNSGPVTVTVQACVPPSNVVAVANPTTVGPGGSSQVSVTASGSASTWQWFLGDPPGLLINGITTPVINLTDINSTTKIFAKATNPCGAVNSNVVTITVVCQNVQITAAFASPSSIISGNNTTLRVNATGSSLAYQWYLGTKGNTSNPIFGQTGFQFTTSLTQTTSFWVRVNGACGGPLDSDTIVVTVAAQCVNPGNAVATATPPAITTGGTTNLSATASGTGLTFQWFTGTPPNGTAINGATGPTLLQQPASTTTYFVRVSGLCGSPIDSNPVTVPVSAACTNPSISTQPASKSIFVGTTATLGVACAGTDTHYQWFEGATGDTSKQRGTDSPAFTSAPLMKQTQYWVRVSGACGQPVLSNTATVEVKGGRPRPVKH